MVPLVTQFSRDRWRNFDRLHGCVLFPQQADAYLQCRSRRSFRMENSIAMLRDFRLLRICRSHLCQFRATSDAYISCAEKSDGMLIRNDALPVVPYRNQISESPSQAEVGAEQERREPFHQF